MAPVPKDPMRKLEFLAARTKSGGRYSFFHTSGKKSHEIAAVDNSDPIGVVQPVGGMSWNKETGEVDRMGVHPDHSHIVSALLMEAKDVAEREGFAAPTRGYLMTKDSARLVRKVNPEAMEDPRARVTENKTDWRSQVMGVGTRSYKLD
ncbi:NAT_SF domain containing protein [uncultured Caudovirales phage]|uniref:NAT_SF domain containing protein n=1 Tax=uncultured Caudovirales phage TaxID=2100421 RepID=A0A6J7WMB3_9CAUD|nr:NAT_SF domain containing protein [uncultured Caudovirales phage]